jgi:hypothetical protein
MYRSMHVLVLLLLAALVVTAQTAQKTSFVGTVSSVSPDQIQVTPDRGAAIVLKITPSTAVQRIAPGEKSLTNAQTIQVSDIAKGDRVLVNLSSDLADLRRVVVMSSDDIKKRNEADRMDWIQRGVNGIVVAKNGSEIKLRFRSLNGEQQTTVRVADATSYRRYAPDSVAFADASVSNLSEISAGDQLRARGKKNENGLEVDADEVVFGTFLTKAGVVRSVDAERNEITIEDLENKKPLVIAVRADSQLKKMPDFSAMAGGGPPGGMRGPTPSPGSLPGGPGMGPRPGGGPDMTQMLERMPVATLTDVKPGQTIVVSSTKGAQANRLTAIMLVANAEFLVRMASMRSGANGPDSAGPSVAGPGMGGMLGELQLPGLMP